MSGSKDLVAKWDRSYQFNDEELVGLISIQESLLVKPKIDERNEEEGGDQIDPELCEALGLPSGGLASFSQFHHLQDLGNEDFEYDNEFKFLKDQVKAIDKLKASIDSLLRSCRQVHHDHAEVKAKSELMQSLWEGLLQQQGNFELFAQKLEERLLVFTQASRLEEALRVSDPMSDPLKEEFHIALEAAIENAVLIMARPEYKEGQVGVFRYKQMLHQAFGAFKTLYDRRLTELNILCREPESPVEYESLTERFKVAAEEFKRLIQLLQKAQSVDNQFAYTLHECMSKLLAARYNLAKRRHQSSIVIEDDLKGMLSGMIGLFEKEQMLFEAFFGDSPLYKRHCDYFCEQVLVLLSERAKTYLSSVNQSELSFLVKWLTGFNSDDTFASRLIQGALHHCNQVNLEEPS